MLYPLVDDENNQLLFKCKTCNHIEHASNPCIYRNSLKEDIAETAGNIDDVSQDPTVGDSNNPSDSAMEGVDFGDDDGGSGMPDFCTLCGQEILCPTCGQPYDTSVALAVDDPTSEMESKGQDIVEAERRERALSGVSGAYRGSHS